MRLSPCMCHVFGCLIYHPYHLLIDLTPFSGGLSFLVHILGWFYIMVRYPGAPFFEKRQILRWMFNLLIQTSFQTDFEKKSYFV